MQLAAQPSTCPSSIQTLIRAGGRVLRIWITLLGSDGLLLELVSAGKRKQAHLCDLFAVHVQAA